ncbi:MAG: amidase [Acidimicrobiales bacterium]
MDWYGTTPEEATIAGLQAAMRTGRTTARRIVEGYLARIEAYDQAGPAVNAVVARNPRALQEADELDETFSRTGSFVGPLHGIPVLVKDQAETRDLPTCFGSAAMTGYQPDTDATVVRKMRDAGAIVLAKSAMPDFAVSWFSFSSKSGETRNPYDLEREPGGSSAGTGAGLAANFAVVGMGEDTGGSIRVPASFCNLVGIRVTPGLISRAGLSPLVVFQDTAGPMGRTVADVARLLDVMVGYDPADPYTAACAHAPAPGGYSAQLEPGRLARARIGVLRSALGADDDPDAGPVNRRIDAAVEAIRAMGAEVVDPVELPDLGRLLELTSLYTLHSKHDLNAFFASRPTSPVRSIEQVYEAKSFHPALDLIPAIMEGPSVPEDDPSYLRRYRGRAELERALVGLLAADHLDALAFPSVQVPPPTRAELVEGKWTTLTFPTNTVIASQSWLPAVTVPAGFTEGGLPVGLELLGKTYDEALLLSLAHAFEDATRHRRPPASTPPLDG